MSRLQPRFAVAPSSTRRLQGELAISVRPPAWIIDPHRFRSDAVVVCLVRVDGVVQGAGTLGAFIDDELRGVQARANAPISPLPRG